MSKNNYGINEQRPPVNPAARTTTGSTVTITGTTTGSTTNTTPPQHQHKKRRQVHIEDVKTFLYRQNIVFQNLSKKFKFV